MISKPLNVLITIALLYGGLYHSQALAQQAPQPNVPNVIVTISVDWEGMSLRDDNLAAFEAFRDQFPKVPVTHFLNAAYYLRDEPADSVTKQIRRVIRPGDEFGLHIHCWRSLVEKSGVTFKTEPTFWGPDRPIRKRNGDEGHEVEMAAYSADEVEKLAMTAAGVLREAGFEISTSFRAGGWIASPEVLQGIRQAGFEVDSSATDRSWHQDEIGRFKIYERMGELWPKVNQHTQPYRIPTTAGTVLEMPDTAALADYVTADEMDIHMKEVLDRVGQDGPRYVHIGFHQETAARFVDRIAQVVAKWQDEAGVEFKSLEQAAQSFLDRKK